MEKIQTPASTDYLSFSEQQLVVSALEGLKKEVTPTQEMRTKLEETITLLQSKAKAKPELQEYYLNLVAHIQSLMHKHELDKQRILAGTERVIRESTLTGSYGASMPGRTNIATDANGRTTAHTGTSIAGGSVTTEVTPITGDASKGAKIAADLEATATKNTTETIPTPGITFTHKGNGVFEATFEKPPVIIDINGVPQRSNNETKVIYGAIDIITLTTGAYAIELEKNQGYIHIDTKLAREQIDKRGVVSETTQLTAAKANINQKWQDFDNALSSVEKLSPQYNNTKTQFESLLLLLGTFKNDKEMQESAELKQKVDAYLVILTNHIANNPTSQYIGQAKGMKEALEGIAGAKTGVVLKNTPETTDGVKEIRESLSEINPENLEKAVAISEKFINLIPNEATKATLQGVHGAVILDIIRKAGHNLSIVDGQVIIEPKPGVDIVNLQTKLQTLINTGGLSLDTLKTGLLYGSATFKAYTELKARKDASGNILINPSVSSEDFMAYVESLKKAGAASADISSLIASESMIKGINFPQAIKGFQDLGQVGRSIEQKPEIMKSVTTATAAGEVANTDAKAQAGTDANKPSEPNDTLTGKLLGEGATAGMGTSIVQGSVSGLKTGLADIIKMGKGDPLATLAIGGGLIYGAYKLFQKFGFFQSVGMLLGIGAINKFGEKGFNGLLDTKAAEVVSDTAGAVGATVSSIADKATNSLTDTTEKPITEDQKYLRDQLMQNTVVLASVERTSQGAEKAKKPEVGKIEDYLKFIENDLRDIPLQDLLGGDHKSSIFYDNHKTALSVPSNLNKKMLKEVLRAYLGGKDTDRIFGSGDTRGVAEKETFLKTYKITPEDIKSKKLSDILTQIHLTRNGSSTGITPTPTTQPNQTTTGANAPKAAPTGVFAIGNKDIMIGEYLRVNPTQNNPNSRVYDATGANASGASLKKDNNGHTCLQKDAAVKIIGETITIGGAPHAKVEYSGSEMYIPIKQLRIA